MKKIYTLIIAIVFCVTIFAQGVWTGLSSGPASQGRAWGIGFAIGNKGYFGGGYNPSIGFMGDFWEYDEATTTWTQKANLTGGGGYYGCTFTLGSKGYVCFGGSTANKNVKEYNQSTNVWTNKTQFPGTARSNACGFSIGPRGFIACGSSGGNEIWQYNQSSDTWIQKTNFPGAARAHAFGFSVSGKAYVGAGVGTGAYLDAYAFDTLTNSWSAITSYPYNGNDHHLGVTMAGKGYVNSYFKLYAYDEVADTWTAMANQQFNINGWYDYMVFATGSKIYAGEGFDGSSVYLNGWEMWSPCSSSPSQPTSISGSATVCNGATNTYSITAVSGATSYTWVLPGGWSGTSTTTSISATASATSGTISVTANNACGSSTAQTLTITVNTVTASTSSTFTTCGTCCDGTATAIPSGGSAPYTYAWSPSGGTAATASGLCNGTYTVCVTDAIGCTTCSTVTVSFNVGTSSILPLTSSINIYPNPFNENVNVNANVNGEMKIYNLLGENVFDRNVVVGNNEINLANLESGIYFMKITTTQGSMTKKIVKD